MRRRVWRLLTIVTPLLLAAGCGSGSFIPPRPAGLNALAKAEKPGRQGTIAMVLGSGDTTDQVLWGSVARADVNKARMAFTISRPELIDPPSRQAEMIRQAVGPGIVGLIVEPIDDPEVAKALNEVRLKGLPVVLIVRAVAASDPPTPPFGLVTFGPAETPLRELVEATRRDAKELKLPDDGSALVLVDPKASPVTSERADRLVAILKGAGVKNAERFPADPDPDKAKQAVEERIKADPKLSILIGTDDSSARAVVLCKQGMPVGRGLAVGACAAVGAKLDPMLVSASALVDVRTPELAREAARLVVRLSRGESAASEVVIGATFMPKAQYQTQVTPVTDTRTLGPAPKNEK